MTVFNGSTLGRWRVVKVYTGVDRFFQGVRTSSMKGSSRVFEGFYRASTRILCRFRNGSIKVRIALILSSVGSVMILLVL